MPKALASAQLAKITQPRVSTYFPRERLYKQLDVAREKPVIWISAPAGAGKTTLIASYLKDMQLPSLWYQLDEGDGDIASFFYHLGLLAKQAGPRRKKQLPLLTTEYLQGLPTFTRNFFREFFARVKSPGILVLDNFQDAPLESGLHECIQAAIDEIPPDFTIIFISRNDPPQVFSRYRASNHMSLLNWDMVRLTLEESIGVGQLHSRVPLDDAVLENLHELTHGWSAGMVLLADQTQTLSMPQEIQDRTDRQVVFDYFANVLFKRTEEVTQQLLMKTSLLPKISPGYATSLTGIPDTTSIFNDLTRRNYFTVRHATSEPVYEYHPLFRAFLVTQLKQHCSSDELKVIYRKAATILALEGDISEAISILQQIRDYKKCVQLIVKHAQSFLNQGRCQTIVQWIEALPKDILEEQPWLVYWLGVSQLPYDPLTARKKFEKIYTQFKAIQDASGQLLTWCAIVDSFAFEYGDLKPLDKWIAEIDQHLQCNEGFPSAEIEARVACGMLIALMNRQPEHPELPRWEQAVWQLVMYSDDVSIRISMGPQLLLYYTWWVGNQAKAQRVYSALEPHMSGLDMPPLIYITWKFMSSGFTWMVAENNRAIEVADEGLARMQETGVRVWEMFTNLDAVIASLSSDQVDKAETYLHNMKSILIPSRYVDNMGYYYLSSWNALNKNKLSDALQCAKLSLENAEKSGNKYFLAIAKELLSRILYHHNKIDEADALAQQVLDDARSFRSNSIEYLYRLTECEVNLMFNSKTELVSVLKNFLELAREHDIRNSPLWQSALMSKLYAIALTHDIESDFILSIISQRKLLPPVDVTVPDSWPFTIKIYTLGRFTLVQDGEPIKTGRKAPKKVLELLKGLIAFGGREVSSEKLIAAIWPDLDGDAAYNTFNTTLHRLRKLLGAEVLRQTEGRVTLDSRYCWVDIWAVERQLNYMAKQEKNRLVAEGPNLLNQILKMYQGPFLAQDTDSAWSLPLRERLHNKLLNQVTALGQIHREAQNSEQAMAIYRTGLNIDPLVERYYQEVMKCCLALERRAEGLAIYQTCRQTLQKVLNVPPSLETELLRQELQQAN